MLTHVLGTLFDPVQQQHLDQPRQITGAAAKAGHDLTIDVTSWEATLEIGGSPSPQLSADPTSLQMREGRGGLQALSDKQTGSATVKQSDWGIKPYSALFGALKVVDDVLVTVEANLG